MVFKYVYASLDVRTYYYKVDQDYQMFSLFVKALHIKSGKCIPRIFYMYIYK